MGVEPSCFPARKAMVSSPISSSTVLTCIHTPRRHCQTRHSQSTPAPRSMLNTLGSECAPREAGGCGAEQGPAAEE